jgi:hypothetical protein
MIAFVNKNIIIPKGARIRKANLDGNVLNEASLEKLAATFISAEMSQNEIEDLLQGMSDRAGRSRLDQFESVGNARESDIIHYTGLTRAQFKILVDSVNESCYLRASAERSIDQAVAVYLHYIRTGFSEANISYEHETSEKNVRNWINRVREALTTSFVYKYMGQSSSSYDYDFIKQRQSKIAKTLLNVGPDDILLICDATYFYIQKSGNYMFQKKTYNDHKKRNYIKPMIITTSDGLIVDIAGKQYLK